MNWKIKALLQKGLALTKLGDKLNHIPITFNKQYHKNVFLYQTHECLRKFSFYDIKLNGNENALEIGTGYSILSAVVLSLLGFKKIITVDITNDLRFSSFKKQIVYMNNSDFIAKLELKSVYNIGEIRSKIASIQEIESLESLFKFLNISYIAPYELEDIEKKCNSFHYISSQVVLEHIPPNILEKLFLNTKKWLLQGGFCVHTINFIDHFANPGFFQDKSISEFNFLRYSDKYWSFWAGNPIAYTNRLSYIHYFELCKKHNLQIINFEGDNYRKRVDLNVNLIHKDILKKYDSKIRVEELTKFQRGTLIIKG